MIRQPMMFSKRGTSAAAVQAMIAAIPADIIVPPAIPGRYYDVQTCMAMGGAGATAITLTANRLYATPVFLYPGTYTKLGVSVGTAGAAGKVLRCAIYAFGTDGLPGSLLLDPGANLAADAIAVVEHTISFAVPVGRFVYTAVQSDGAPVLYGYPAAGQAEFGRTTATSTSRFATLHNDPGSYGFPATFGTPTVSIAQVPSVWMRL